MRNKVEPFIKGNCYCPSPRPNDEGTKCLQCLGYNPKEIKSGKKTK